MPKFKKRPDLIEAVKWTGENFDEVSKFAGSMALLDGEGNLHLVEPGSRNGVRQVSENFYLYYDDNGPIKVEDAYFFERVYEEVK